MIEIGTLAENGPQTNAWGIDLSYEDAFGKAHGTSPETIAAILESMGADRSTLAPLEDDSVIVITCGNQREFAQSGTIVLETGETLTFESRLPVDLPCGYHQLQLEGAETAARLIVSPGQCYLPEFLKTWGWAVQLYAARSRESWGIGDFADLDTLAKWSANELGAGMMLLNPLSAATPITPQQGSPYFPTSRRFSNPLAIHIEWIPGATSGSLPQLEEIARAGRELNSTRLIDRDKVFALKTRALEILWLQFSGDRMFDEFCTTQGADLDRFAIFCALAEHHQSGWHAWPAEYQHPSSRAVVQFAQEHERRILFYKWLQWILYSQLARCSQHLALMQDLPIGVDPDGADAWAWQDVFAKGVAVGAPPDEFNTQGQNWGLPPFVPHKLRAACYEPFIQTIRAAFRHGGGLRIDHVMGLFRLFWIPSEMSASHGTYVRYNSDEMLAIVALESERAKAYVVGEDLGTVEDSARQMLAQHRIMSYRLLWFEKDHPSKFPHEALAAVTTHDLPTVAGLWSGSDLKKQQQLGLKPNEKSTSEIHQRLAEMAHLRSSASPQQVVSGAYGLLAQAPSRILTAALDDALAVEERPNIPATMPAQNPNWSMALPMPIEELMAGDLPKQIAGSLQRQDT